MLEPLFLKTAVTRIIFFEIPVCRNRRQTNGLSILCFVGQSVLTVPFQMRLWVFDSVFNLVDDLIEFMLSQVWQLTLRRQSMEGLH